MLLFLIIIIIITHSQSNSFKGFVITFCTIQNEFNFIYYIGNELIALFGSISQYCIVSYNELIEILPISIGVLDELNGDKSLCCKIVFVLFSCTSTQFPNYIWKLDDWLQQVLQQVEAAWSKGLASTWIDTFQTRRSNYLKET